MSCIFGYIIHYYKNSHQRQCHTNTTKSIAEMYLYLLLPINDVSNCSFWLVSWIGSKGLRQLWTQAISFGATVLLLLHRHMLWRTENMKSMLIDVSDNFNILCNLSALTKGQCSNPRWLSSRNTLSCLRQSNCCRLRAHHCLWMTASAQRSDRPQTPQHCSSQWLGSSSMRVVCQLRWPRQIERSASPRPYPHWWGKVGCYRYARWRW